MSRKISVNSANAFMSMEPLKIDNTRVMINENFGAKESLLFLFDNLIATYDGNCLMIRNCGWFTKTTKERLNALPNVMISQRNGKWFLNGVEWYGKWTKIEL